MRSNKNFQITVVETRHWRVLIAILILLMSSPFLIQAQTITRPCPTPKSVKLSFTGEVYVLTESNEVLQLDTLGKTIRRYSPNPPMNFESLHFTNQWQLFLFSPESQQIVYLDRFLVPINRYDLPFDLGYVRLAAPSADQTIWFWSETDRTIIRYDPLRFEELIRINLNTFNFSDTENYIPQLEEFQNVLHFSYGGYFLFDALGNLLEKQVVETATNYQVMEEKVLGFSVEKQEFTGFDFKSRTKLQSPSTDSTRHFIFGLKDKRRTWLWDAKNLYIFK
ncbi:MAG: hypothetical protein AAF740_02310 [Bacteroidota bacterium]